MELPDLSRICTDRLPASFTGTHIPIDILRLDKIHSVISGNKWFKLHKYLEIAEKEKKKRIVSFGGPWSNHIIAAAAAAQLHGFSSLGFIRGERTDTLTRVLQQCQEMGMELIFTDRASFDQRHFPEGVIREEDLLIPMGGFGIPGMEGASAIMEYFDPLNYSHICCATGTGTMMAGLLKNSSSEQTVMGFSAVKNDPHLENNIRSLLPGYINPIHYQCDQRFGGFAKYNDELIRFMNELYEVSGIPTDIVYTAKLCYEVIRKAGSGDLPQESRVMIIHSGGLTGNHSLKNGMLIW
jgi:1-aminocyclopropane-1-carboxylate deaminase